VGNKRDEVAEGAGFGGISRRGSSVGASSNVIDRLGDVCTGSQRTMEGRRKKAKVNRERKIKDKSVDE